MDLEPQSAEIARRLTEAFPGCEANFSSRDGILRVEWPSRNPTVQEPLVLDCSLDPRLFWFEGYFYDFPDVIWGDDARIAEAIVDFLGGFFADRIARRVRICDGKVASGGPVWFDQEPHNALRPEPGVIIRSWTGSRDSGQDHSPSPRG